MPDINDYYAFTNTTDGDSSGAGCTKPFLIVCGIIAVLYLIGRLFG